jgi:hypothetical protein
MPVWSPQCPISARLLSHTDKFRHTSADRRPVKRSYQRQRALERILFEGHELFPDTALEVISTFECGNHIVAEKITAREIMPLGSMQLRLPISFQGASIVRIENGKITSWSDYYDQNTFRRFRLGVLFEEWIEY